MSDSRDFTGMYRSRRVGNINVAYLTAKESSRVHRWQSVRPQTNSDRTLAQIQCQGTSMVYSESKVDLISQGDLKFGRNDLPYSVTLSDRNSVILIDFPSDLLGTATPAEGMLRHNSQSVKKLQIFSFDALDQDTGEIDDDENSDEIISNVFSTLIRQCDEIEPVDHPDNSLLFRRASSFVDSSLWDSSLRTNAIADHLAVSRKQVQRMFAGLGMTPSQYILNRRINLAAYMLRSTFDGTVTDLAMEVGFSDAAHFCRRFRRTFGLTPTEYARRQRNN